ncbi:hypothetical protein [Corynebacterium lactis]|uniref:Uncharacterized protein n=1 Tax=Corynebacterium lactis RW2-5 TaxID=1408189 RepID=A0A0K2H422_9CORY|nr:hypothetical protein [Corynebacterium lactis]ALA68471.1 hypothetical protein CLAC_03950 [Corynebacterium lactis RW2-5]
MSKGSSNGCVWLFLIIIFLGALMWLVGAALWLLQFIIPIVGVLIALGLAVDSWSRVKQRRQAERLAELSRAELVSIATESEYRLNEIMSKWDAVARTMGIGTAFREAFSSGQATPELVQLRADLTRAERVSESLRAAIGNAEDADKEELVDVIEDADQLWATLTERYWGSSSST